MTRIVYEAARRVVEVSRYDCGETLAHAINGLERALKGAVALPPEIEAARRLHSRRNHIEIDDFAYAVRGQGHVWVQAWVCVGVSEIERKEA